MYTKFYKFSSRPFALTPDLKFLFRSDGHKRALSYLHYGLDQAEGFVVITGQIGAGKTILIQALLEDLKTQEIATARVAAANLTKDEIIPMVAAALKQPYEGKSKTAIIRDLELSLRRARDYLKGVLLIVDEAQTLTPDALEELRILSNLESNGAALMQIFLIGQSDFRDTLQLPTMEPLRQRIVASYNLEPLTQAELKRYIGFRLLAVGWDAHPTIDNEVYKVVHEFTGGIPRKINIFMDRFFVFGFLDEISRFTVEHANSVARELSGELAGDFLKDRAGAHGPVVIETDIDPEEQDLSGSHPIDLSKKKVTNSPDLESQAPTLSSVDDELDGVDGWEVTTENSDDTINGKVVDESGEFRSPLERRLRGLDKKLRKLSDKTRYK